MKSIVVDSPSGNIQYDLLQFLIGCIELDVVQVKQGEHSEGTNTFVSVVEGMIHYKSVTKPDGFVCYGWIEFIITKSLKRGA